MALKVTDLPLGSLAESYFKKANSDGGHPQGKTYIRAYIILLVIFLFIDPDQTLRNFICLGYFAPIWAPMLLYKMTFFQFVESRKAAFIANQKTILLELLMPRDTKKTPLAMEIVFANMHQGPGEGTWYNRLWLGKVRPWWSLEIVSLGGRVHFYIWTRAGFRRAIESYFYAQFPDMQIVEAEDYSLLFDPSDSEKNSMFGDEYAHTQPDPYPIKTYVDYGLVQANAKPEEQIDPFSQIIETLASLGPQEQFWMQFIIRTTGVEKFKDKNEPAALEKFNADFGEKASKYTWKEEAIEVISKIRAKTVKKNKIVDPVTGKVTETESFPNPSKGQTEMINAIERGIAKQGFDVGIRAIYSAPKEAYQGTMIGTMLSIFKPFSNETYNGFKPAGTFSAKFEDYPWEDRDGKLHKKAEKNIVEFYRRRAFYHAPYQGTWMIMSTEELATLFHVPTATVTAPGLPRIQSTTSGAPVNLPT